MIKILRLKTYIDLIAKVEQYKKLLELEREICSKQEEQIKDLEKELEKEKQKSMNIQKICFDSCL